MTLGWGVILPNPLQWIQIPIHSHQECEDKFPGYITDGMICAGGPGAATCNVNTGCGTQIITGPEICLH